MTTLRSLPLSIRLRVLAKEHLPGFLVRALQFLFRRIFRPLRQRAERAWAGLVKAAWLARNIFGRGGPLPPGGLIALVSGSPDIVWFLKSGRRASVCFKGILAANGISMKKLRGILDFGCGVGRVIRQFRGLKNAGLNGVDYNPDLIAWCRENIRFARFEVNSFLGPLPYADGSFDLVYAFSVFTHLTKDQQSAWIEELRRIIRPGGFLLVSVHGEFHVRSYAAEAQDRFARGEMVVFAGEAAGTNLCTTFHPPVYMKTHFAPGFDLIDMVQEGALGNPRQDLYLFRKE